MRYKKGVLLTCDIPIRQYILYLDAQKEADEKFVIDRLDDTHLFVKANSVDWIQDRVKELHERNAYRDLTGVVEEG